MRLLCCKDRKAVLKPLCNTLHPILDYYIKYYLYRNRIHDAHDRFSELYHDLYGRCVSLLSEMEAEGNTFNRIKRYLNKSIGGWLLNILYKKKRSDIEFVQDDTQFFEHLDETDPYMEVEYNIDLQRLAAHIKRELVVLLELTAFALPQRKQSTQRNNAFQSFAYTAYCRTGMLVTAEEYLKQRYGWTHDEPAPAF